MIKSAAQSSISNGKKFSSMAAGYVASSDFKLAETIVSSPVASVTFDVSSYAAQGYKNLQIRMATRDTIGSTGSAGVWLQMNSDTASNYAWHRVGGGAGTAFSGGSASATRILVGLGAKSTDSANVFGAVVTDILDFASTSKNKTIRSLAGNASSISSASMEINLNSGLWLSTSAVTSLTISGDTSFAADSRFSLYGSL